MRYGYMMHIYKYNYLIINILEIIYIFLHVNKFFRLQNGTTYYKHIANRFQYCVCLCSRLYCKPTTKLLQVVTEILAQYNINTYLSVY